MQADQCGQDKHTYVARGVDDFDSPLLEDGGQLTHRVSFTGSLPHGTTLGSHCPSLKRNRPKTVAVAKGQPFSEPRVSSLWVPKRPRHIRPAMESRTPLRAITVTRVSLYVLGIVICPILGVDTRTPLDEGFSPFSHLLFVVHACEVVLFKKVL